MLFLWRAIDKIQHLQQRCSPKRPNECSHMSVQGRGGSICNTAHISSNSPNCLREDKRYLWQERGLMGNSSETGYHKRNCLNCARPSKNSNKQLRNRNYKGYNNKKKKKKTVSLSSEWNVFLLWAASPLRQG